MLVIKNERNTNGRMDKQGQTGTHPIDAERVLWDLATYAVYAAVLSACHRQ